MRERGQLQSRSLLRAMTCIAVAAAACGKRKDTPASPPAEPTPPLARLARDTNVEWAATESADGTFLLRPRTPEPPRAGDRVRVAHDFVVNYGGAVGIAADELVKPPAAADASLVLLGQQVHGIPVAGGLIAVHFAPDGGIESVSGKRLLDLPQPYDAASPELAIAAFEAHLAMQLSGVEASWFTAPPAAERAWWGSGIDEPRVVHVVRATLDAAHGNATLSALIDGEGEIVEYSDGTHHTIGSGRGARATKTLEVDDVAGTQFFLRRSLAGSWPGPPRCGPAPAKQPRVFVHAGSGGPIVSASRADGPWDGDAAPSARAYVDAYDHAELAARYFRDRYCRNSFDGVGSDIHVVIDPARPNGGFWLGDTMTFGLGDARDGQAWLSPVASLEVVTHELTHGIVNSVVNKTVWRAIEAVILWHGELHTLAEALGDVFGQLAEESYALTYNGRGRDPGLLGENWIESGPGFERSFKALPPHVRDAPRDRYSESLHISHAFHVMTSGPAGISFDQAESVWYGALARLHPASTFRTFASDTLVVADAMNRRHGARISLETIACAWVKAEVLLPADIEEQWRIRCHTDREDSLLGRWDWTNGDWGTMSFVRAADEKIDGQVRAIVRGVYTYRDGTVRLVCDQALRTCRGVWFEGSRSCTTQGDHGRAEFRLDTLSTIDGKWAHLGGSWRHDWDLKRSGQPIPSDDLARLRDDSLFRCP